MAYELKTKENVANVKSFLNAIEDEQKRKDCYAIIDIMQEVTGFEPKMWGSAIIGFGSYHYKYASGHEGDMALVSFSPRKANITLYLMGAMMLEKSLIEKLGKFKHGKGCLYINKLEDINIPVLKDLIRKSNEYVKNMYKS
jgi:hypothetical protein